MKLFEAFERLGEAEDLMCKNIYMRHRFPMQCAVENAIDTLTGYAHVCAAVNGCLRSL